MKALENVLLSIAVILCIGLLAFLAVPNFIRGGHPPLKNNCINNLRWIDAAKQQWALENNKTNSDTPTWADIKQYMGRGGGYIPKCPSGGTYTLGAVDQKPTCSVTHHVLP